MRVPLLQQQSTTPNKGSALASRDRQEEKNLLEAVRLEPFQDLDVQQVHWLVCPGLPNWPALSAHVALSA